MEGTTTMPVESNRDTPLAVGDLIPYFDLPGTNGERVSRATYRGRQHLVIVFLHSAPCTSCAGIWRVLLALYSSLRDEQAEVIVVLGTSMGTETFHLARTSPPFPVIVDNGVLAARFRLESVSETPVALVVADRHGEIRLATTGSNDAGDGTHALHPERILPLLELLQVTCSV